MEKMKFNYNQIDKGYYHDIYNKKNPRSNWHKIKFNKVLNSIKKDTFHNGILDYGCGPGTFLNLSNSKFKVGYDIAEDQLSFARKLVTDAQFTSNHSFLESQFKNISHIVACELIEHLNKDKIIKLLDLVKIIVDKRLDNMLSTSFLITTPNYRSLWPLLEIFVDLVSRQNYRAQHISKFNPSLIHNLLNNHFSKNVYDYTLHVSSFQGFSWISKYLNFTDKIIENFNIGNLIFSKITFYKFKK